MTHTNPATQPAYRASKRRTSLDLKLGNGIEPPSAAHSLLLAFHFGRPHPDTDHPAVTSLNLPPLEQACLFESWWYRGPVRFAREGAVRIAECDDYAVLILETDWQYDEEVQEVTRRAYEQLLDAVGTTSHQRGVKIWNYIGGINNGDRDLECYRQFSVGRASAFNDRGIDDASAPTGTAIGTMDNSGLTLIALASRHSFALTENPRQVSAFHYPRRYGPKSPKFSRGGVVAAGDHRLFLVSGTAAVIGHESAHPYDAELQTLETVRNLDSLCSAASQLDTTRPRLALQNNALLRVYLRNPEEFDRVADKLRDALGAREPTIAFLQGHICRRELVVEIDGVEVT